MLQIHDAVYLAHHRSARVVKKERLRTCLG